MKAQNALQNLIWRTRGCAAVAAGAVLLAAMTANAQADYQSTVLGDNPVAYYALNPGTDGLITAPDLTESGNDGNAAGIAAATGPSLYITNAANFNGAAAIDLSQGSNPGLLNFSGPITMEAWVQPTNSTEGPADIIAKGYDGSQNDDEVTLRAGAGTYFGGTFSDSKGNQAASGGSQTTNWTYVVCTYDGTNWNMYVNAVLVQSSPDPVGAINFSDDWVIGDGSASGGSRFFIGNISEVALYNYALTSAQVLNHFYYGEINASSTVSPPIITVQPQPQSTYPGGSATFSVAVVSAFATTNQWLKNGNPITGQTNLTLTLNNVQSGDASNYSVIIGNSAGITNSAIVALSLFMPAYLEWSAGGNSGVWDTTNSVNWINLSNSATALFNPNDQVIFDDLVGTPTTVTVSGTVSPSLITVNSSTNNYTFTGSGSISGSVNLVKEGTSTLTITNAASITGSVLISGGAVYAGSNCFASASSITITNSSTLDLAGGALLNHLPLTVSGMGLNGEGAIYNSYSSGPVESVNLTLAGDTKFGGSARWDLASGSQISGAHNLTVDWSAGAGYGQWNTVSIGAEVSGIFVTNGGQLGMSYMDTSCQNPDTLFTIGANTQLIFYNGGFNGSIHVLSGGTVYIYTAPAPFNGSNLILEDNASWVSYYNAGANTSINSAVTLNGIAHVVIGDHYMIYTNVIGGPGGFVLDFYNNDMVLSASNTYSGPTIIGSSGNTPQVALTGNGSISHSSLIFFGGSDPTVMHFDVSGRSDQTLTLASGQTLAGVGAINGSLVVSSGATISPAGSNTSIGITTGSNPTGALAVVNNITLNGTTLIKLDGSGTNDAIAAEGQITYGGTLSLLNISGSPLAVGNSFQIFIAANYANSFANVTPATPGPGLVWDVSQLNNGIIGVAAAPAITGASVSAGNFVFSGTGGTPNGTYYVWAATNLAAPHWVPIATNSFDGGGGFAMTNALTPGAAQQFYKISE